MPSITLDSTIQGVRQQAYEERFLFREEIHNLANALCATAIAPATPNAAVPHRTRRRSRRRRAVMPVVVQRRSKAGTQVKSDALSIAG